MPISAARFSGVEYRAYGTAQGRSLRVIRNGTWGVAYRAYGTAHRPFPTGITWEIGWMIEFVMEAGGRAAMVRALFESTRNYCAGYLCEREADFVIEMDEADIAKERSHGEQADRMDGLAVRRFSDAYLETLALQRKLTEELFSFDTLLFHGSCVAVDAEGYLFAAKSGTGKSTHVRLWREMLGDRAVMVNDDKPFLRMENGRVFAHGSPWNGKHRLGNNMCVPLKAICILERGEENEICKISASDALKTIFQQTYRPMRNENFPKYFDLMGRLASGTAFYRLKCNMEKDAAKVSYEGMKEC